MALAFRITSLIFLLFFSNLAYAAGLVCDVDADDDVDIVDVRLVSAGRNQPASEPIDPRDADGDGWITVLDARSCVGMCTLARCVEPPANTIPLANAGRDQTVSPGDSVTLDGSESSDADGDPLTFSWTISAAPAQSSAALSDPGAVMPGFVADSAGEYRFELIVNDGRVDSAPDEVVIVTSPLNTPPLANAGVDQTVMLGDTVFLDGSGSSDVDLDPLSFSWRFTGVPANSAATLSDPAAESPSFFADLPGIYVVELTTNDGRDDSLPDSVSITTANSRPVADAGADQSVLPGDPVQLDGSGSFDADNDPLTFSWSLSAIPQASSAALDSNATVDPSFVADVPGIFVAQLIVNDGSADSLADTVVIQSRDDSLPTAVLDLRDANGQPVQNGRISLGQDFILDGSRSTDIGGQISRFEWAYEDGGQRLTTQDASINSSLLLQGFSLPVGRHRFTLQVSDDSGNQSQAVELSVIMVDVFAPTAVLDLRDAQGGLVSDGRIPFGEDFILDGSRSTDIGGQISRFEWAYEDGGQRLTTQDASINSSLLLQGFSLPVGRHRFTLQVSDDSGNQSQAVELSVIMVDVFAPTAVLDLRDAQGRLVSDGRIPFGEDFILDGSRSTDIGGQISRFEWAYEDGGQRATTQDASINSSLLLQGFSLPVGRHRFTLQVSDDSGNQSQAVELSVIMVDVFAPTAVLDLRDAQGRLVSDGRIPLGEDFILDGSRSADIGGQIERFEWAYEDGGQRATTQGASINSSLLLQGFSLPVGRHRFTLQVSDDSGNQSQAVELSVIMVDVFAPTAVLDLRDAQGRLVSDGRIPLGEDFILDGSRSADIGGQIERFEWAYEDGGQRATTQGASINSSLLLQGFSLPVGRHRFTLQVSDDSGNQSQAVELSVIMVDVFAPTAVLDLRDAQGRLVSDGRIPLGEDFILDGSRSADIGGQIERFEWAYEDGGQRATTQGASINSSLLLQGFSLPVGRHRFTLQVSDDSGNQSQAVELSVIMVDVFAPTAVLDLRDAQGRLVSDGRIPLGEDFILDGSRSADIGGQIERFEWAYEDGGQRATTQDASINSSLLLQGFSLPVGRHRFTLQVSDDSGNQSQAVELSVIMVDVFAPTAVLDLRDAQGRQVINGRIPVGEDFILDGSRSTDIGGQISSFEWTYEDTGQQVKTANSTVEASLLLQGIKLPVGQHRFNLVVTDDSGNQSQAAQLIVIVVDVFSPTAVLDLRNANGQLVLDDRIPFGEDFILYGSRSSDDKPNRLA